MQSQGNATSWTGPVSPHPDLGLPLTSGSELVMSKPPVSLPGPEALMQALEDLDYLAALDDDGELSDLGIILSEFPLPPELAKALLASCEFKCVDEMLTLAAMLTGTFLAFIYLTCEAGLWGFYYAENLTQGLLSVRQLPRPAPG